MVAVKGFLSNGGSFMHFQIFTECKIFVAVIAVEEFLSSEGSFMHFQVFKGRKSFFCNGSIKWVCVQCGFFHELTNLPWTLKLFCSHGSWRVSQIITGCKSCIAINVVEGFLSSVGSFIHFQIFKG